MAEEAIRALMEQGMRMGIYAYLLVDCQLDTALIHRLSADYATCALSVVSMDSRLTNETLDELEGTDNVMLIAAQDGPTFTSAALSAGAQAALRSLHLPRQRSRSSRPAKRHGNGLSRRPGLHAALFPSPLQL